MRKIISFLDEHLEMMICLPMLVVMSIVIFFQVIMRYVFSNSLSWSEELSCYLFVWLSFLGCSYGIKAGKHMRVDVLINVLPEKISAVLSILADLMFFVFAVLMVVYGISMVETFAQTGQRAAGIYVPTWLLYFSCPLGMAVSAIRLIQNIVKTVRNAFLRDHKGAEEK